MKGIKIEKIKPGDIYAVPLGEDRYGYVRMYNGLDVSFFGVITYKRIMKLDEIKTQKIVGDGSALAKEIQKGNWTFIGNMPFLTENDKNMPPHKQIVPWNNEIRLVAYKGNMIDEKDFGEYDNLPALRIFSDDRLISEIVDHPNIYIR